MSAKRDESGWVAKRDPEIRVAPLKAHDFADLEKLFGKNGACGGCWCMTPRLSRRDYEANKGEPNRRALAALAAREPSPGVLLRRGAEPIAWCAIAPRADYVRLETSRILAPLDDAPVWSIVCLFVAKTARRSGMSSLAIEGAVEYARRCGARIVEAYPIDPDHEDMPPAFAWTGLLRAYQEVGFVEVARRSRTRPIVRFAIETTKRRKSNARRSRRSSPH